jgi:hypothetical protein
MRELVPERVRAREAHAVALCYGLFFNLHRKKFLTAFRAAIDSRNYSLPKPFVRALFCG